MTSSEPRVGHIWMPDRRTLCDRRAAIPTDLASMDDDTFEAWMTEQQQAPACGPCILLASRIRRMAGVLLAESRGKVHPPNPSEAWCQLRDTRWAADIDLDDFLIRPDLDVKIKYEAINYETDSIVVSEMVAERAAHRQYFRQSRDERRKQQAD